MKTTLMNVETLTSKHGSVQRKKRFKKPTLKQSGWQQMLGMLMIIFTLPFKGNLQMEHMVLSFTLLRETYTDTQMSY